MQANAALLEAIEGEAASSNELMQLYLRTIPALQVASKLLHKHKVGANVPV